MVRRKGMAARGLANQLRMQLTSPMTPSPAAANYGGWQQATVPLSLPQWQWHQQSQPLLHTLCNKMSGCMPRQPILPQPEPSSRRLSRLRRNLMSSQPPTRGTVPQQMAMPPYPWSRVEEAQATPRNVDTRQVAGDSLQQAKQVKRQQERQLWQRLQLQQQQQRLQQQQREQQRQQQVHQQQQRWQLPVSVATPPIPPKIHFKPFNFGKCAENYLNSEQSKAEFTLYAASNGSATQVGPGGKPVSILKNTQKDPLKQFEDFGYVKAAKQMVDTATDCGKPTQFSAAGNASSITTLSSKCGSTAEGCQSVENTYQMSSSQMTLRPSNESLNQIAAGIDSNLSALRQLLAQQPQAPQIDAKELERLATLLHERIGVDTKPGVHLKGGESQQLSQLHSETVSELEPELEPETVSKCSYDGRAGNMSLTSSFRSLNELPAGTVRSSHERLASMGTTKIRGSHERQLNLSKLFQQQHIQGDSASNPNPMWETLMQLANRMCGNRDESTEKPPKQYSIYLMVSSDEENDETESQQVHDMSALMENSSAIYPACIPDRMSYKHPEHFGEPAGNYYPWHSGARRKKKKLWSKQWEKSNLLITPRRPLHWPKPDYSCLAAPSKSKKPKKVNWLQFCQPSRRCHYRWVQ